MDLESTLDRLREVTPIIKGSDLESVVRQVQSVYEYLSPLIKDLQEIGRDLSIVKEMFHSIFTKFEKLTIQEEEIQVCRLRSPMLPREIYLCTTTKPLCIILEARGHTSDQSFFVVPLPVYENAGWFGLRNLLAEYWSWSYISGVLDASWRENAEAKHSQAKLASD